MKSATYGTVTGTGEMTLSGTLGKVGILLALLFAGATVGWLSHNMVLLFVGLIGGLVLSW